MSHRCNADCITVDYNFNLILHQVLIYRLLHHEILQNILIKYLHQIALINLKQYKKGELLLFIALALLFRGLHVVKYTEFRGIQVFRVTLEKVQFFKTFVSFYLPTLGLQENYVQTLKL